MTSALDTVVDPLLTPLLGLLQDAINADLAAEVPPAPDTTAEPAVATTAPHPVPIVIAGETALPLLACYRVRSRARQRSISYVDHTQTLQFSYLSAATAREQLPARWPSLERVYQALLKTLRAGHHPAHAGDANVLEGLGIIDVPLSTLQKRELFAEGGDFTYPMFLLEVDVVVQTATFNDPSTLYPALSFETGIYIGCVTEAPPDVSVISYTPLGEAVRDGLIDEGDLVPP